MVVDFYLSLTADLTGIMTDEVNPEPELPPLQPGCDVEKQLLEIEVVSIFYKRIFSCGVYTVLIMVEVSFASKEIFYFMKTLNQVAA